MSSTTSEERREVAERLRENATKHGVTLDYFGSKQVESWWLLLHTIDCDSNEQEVAFRMLADLIDPTCHLVSTTFHSWSDGSAAFYHELSCGHICETVWGKPPSYCPECGARVVDGTEHD